MAGIGHIAELKQPALRGIVEEVNKAKLETQDEVLNFLPDEYTYDQEFAYNVISKTSQLGAMIGIGNEPPIRDKDAVARRIDRKSTRLNTSHVATSDAAFCLKKQNNPENK